MAMKDKTGMMLDIGDVVYDAGHRVYGTIYGFVCSVSGEIEALINATHNWSREPRNGGFIVHDYNATKIAQGQFPLC